MSLVRNIFIATSVTCGVAFVTKIVLISANDGQSSLPIGILWGLGMATFLIAAGTGVAFALRSRPAWLRVVAVVVAVPAAFASLDSLDLLVKSVYRADGWFRDELALVITGVVFASIGLAMLSRRSARRAPQESAHLPVDR